jgi:hypothetical protein
MKVHEQRRLRHTPRDLADGSRTEVLMHQAQIPAREKRPEAQRPRGVESSLCPIQGERGDALLFQPLNKRAIASEKACLDPVTGGIDIERYAFDNRRDRERVQFSAAKNMENRPGH